MVHLSTILAGRDSQVDSFLRLTWYRKAVEQRDAGDGCKAEGEHDKIVGLDIQERQGRVSVPLVLQATLPALP